MKKNVNRALVAKKKFSKISLTLLAGLLLTFAFPSQGWAFDTNYYARLKAQVSGNSDGRGTVYANTSNDGSGTYSTSSTSANQTTTTSGANLSFYAFAKPNTGYMFEGWSSSNNSTSIASTDNPYTVTVSASSESSSSPSEKTVYAVFKEIPMAIITYKAPINGSYSYSYSGEVVTMNPGDADKQKQTKESVKLTATPADGYAFLRWKKTTSDGVSYFGGNPAENVGFDKDATVEAEFVPDTWALFVIRDGDGTQYANLNEANTAALASTSKTIVVAKDGELIAGDYTISSAVTLVVPFESTGSKGVTKPVGLSNSTLPVSLYRKLTLLPGANITLQGNLAVAAQVQSGDASHNPCGFPVGPVGCLDMSKGGHIDVESGGTLYVWGFIKGQDYLDGNNTQNVGTITAKNGSTIKECYGTADWSGGSYAYAVGQNSKSYRIYPFQGYFVQNIEVPLRMEYGAKDYLYCNVYAGGGQNEVNDIPFIGNTTGVLFKINGTDGAVTKWYDPTTDHLVVELEGNASLDNLKMNIYIDINANEFDLPIVSNMHLKLKDCQLTLSAPMKLEAGAILEIPAGSSLTLKSNLYVYDHDQWGKYVQKKYFKPLTSTNMLTQLRSRGDGATNTLDDAQIICDGAIIMANGGGIYTTASGADVMGHNGGTIQWESSLPANSTTYGYTNGTGVTGSNFSSTLTPEFCDGAVCTPAKAHNENDSYTAAKAGTTFTNVSGRWFGGDAKNEKDNHTYDFTYINGDADVTTEAIYWLDAAGEGHWNNATTTDVTYLNTWKGTEEETGITAYYAYTVYDQDNNPHDGWIKLTQVGTSENFGGSDNNMYVYVNDKWQSIGSTDSECLYTIGGVRQALVVGTLVPITKNTTPEDGAWHATATPTNYYVDLSSGSCIWTPATKVAGVEKAYTIEGTTYLRYDADGMGEDWMAVQYQAPFYYTVDEQNLRTYYEYNANTGAWQEAAPKVTVTDEKGASQSFFFLTDAIAAAGGTYNPTITLLADVEENSTSEWIVTSTVKSTKYTINLNGHTATLTRGNISGTSFAATGRIMNINSAMDVTIQDKSAEQNGTLRLIGTGNGYVYGIGVSAGNLTIESGNIYAENTAAYASNTSERCYAVYAAAGTTVTMNGGSIATQSDRYSYGIYGLGAASAPSTIDFNNGSILALSDYYSYGIISSGNINVKGGEITGKTGAVHALTGHTTAYGIYVNASANATESSAYGGILTMTGGVVNAYATTTTAYGVYILGTSTTKSGAKDGTYSNKSSAKATITGGTINAETKSTTAYGVYVLGGADSDGNVKTIINNTTINVSGTNTVHGIYAAASIADLTAAKCYGIVETNGCDVTVNSTSTTTAYAVYVQGAVKTLNATTYNAISASNKKTWYYKDGQTSIKATDKQTYKYQNGYYEVGAQVTINGGSFKAYTKTTTSYGVYCDGKVVINGGEFTATAGTNTAYGVYVGYKTAGAANTTAATPYYYYSNIYRAQATINGGTFIAQTAAVDGSKPTTTCYGVYSLGETTITGGTINALPTTTTAYGVYCGDGTMMISGNPTVIAKATEKAYGAVVNGISLSSKTGLAGRGVLNVSGGTFNAETTTGATAYGLYVERSSTTISSTADGYYPNTTPYVGFGTANISGGKFTAIAKTTTSYGAATNTAVTGIFAANSTASAIAPSSLAAPTLNITGGEFYATSNGTATKATDGVAIGINFNTSAKGSLSNATISARTTSDYYRYPHGLKVGAGVDLTVDNCTISATSERYTAAYGVRVYANTSGQIGKLTMSNTKVTATAGTSSAYAVYVDRSSVVSTSEVGRSAVYYAEAILNEGNEVLATTGTGMDGVTPTTTAYGIYSAGNTTINGGSYKGMPTTKIAAGLNVVEGHVTMNGGTLEGIGTSEAYGAYVYGYFNSDYGYFSNSELEINDGTFSSTTTTGATSYALWVSGSKKVGAAAPAKVTGATTMDYAYAGSAVVNGGVFTAHAKTKTVNAVYVGATQTANAEVAYPTCIINAGKFSATQTDSKTVVANINADSKEPNKFVLNGGYYTKNSNLATYKVADKAVRTLPSDHAEYANGYRYSIEKGYKVTFLDDNTTVLKTIDPAFVGDMPSCDNPTKAATVQYTYTFNGWTPAIVAVTEDATYTATYTATKNKYAITFKNEDGTELQKTEVEYGTTPSYTGATPIKAADAQYTYTFNDWDKEIVPVTGTATYTATYTATKNKYAITFKNEDGTELQKTEVEYGTTPSYTRETPTKAATAEYTYTFNDWDKEIVPVTGTATYTATYTQTKKKYTLTWELDDGEVKTAGTTAGSVEWGTSLTAPIVEKTGYTFAGWTPSVPATMPAADATYTAQWTAQQEVTYMVEHYHESALGVKEDTPFRTDEGSGLIGAQVSADDVLKLEGYDSPDPSTETITEGLVVKYYYRSRNLNVASEVVIAGADLDQIVVENNGTLSASAPSTVERLVLTATPGNNDGANADLTNITISESVCIEIEMNSTGTMDDKLYYCFSVPFNVNVDDGVKRLNETNGNWESAVLNTNYRVYTYNEADRATYGRSDNNWTLFNGDQFLPGVFYLCEFDNSNYNRYRFYAADKTKLDNKKDIDVFNTGDKTNGGWNGVANNGLTDNQLSGDDDDDFTIIQILNSEGNCFETATASKTPLAIGNAAMVQVNATGSVLVGKTSSAVAARRMGETASTEFINVRLYKENQDKHVDQIFIRASEDAAEQYVAGIDLSKATMGTPKVARLWVNDYDLQLVANEALMTNDQATFSLGMSAPANGEYIIALNEVPTDATIYLTENGSAIWNLNIAPAPISLSKGTENSYGLRLVRKINNVVTGFDEAVLNGNVQKVILNDHMYIIRDGKVYSAHGHVIK